MLYRFVSIRKSTFAVLVDASQIAEVTVSPAHCALTPTKGHATTPADLTAIEVFMQTHEKCDYRRKCQRCPRLLC